MLILREEVLHSYGISASDGILIALSGGADSVALLLEMNRFRKEGKLRTIAAAHLNHGIRGEEALRDAAFCRALCQRERIPFYEKTTDVPSAAKQRGVSLETAARSERYAFLNEVAKKLEFRWIATAHHRDDQAETLLLHLLRGCGTDGLAGMQECSGNLIRPFLRIPKSEILNYLAERNEPFCTDSTNSSPEHLRNRIRQEVLPLLNTLRPNASGALANTAALVAIDAAYWKEQADRIYRSNPTRFELAELPESLRMRVLKRFVPYDDYDRNDFLTLNDLLHSQTGTQRHLKNGYTAWTSSDRLHVDRIDPESFCKTLPIGTWVPIPHGRILVRETDTASFPCSAGTAYLNADAVHSPLLVRSPQIGDRFQPFGMQGTKLLSDYLTDRKVPRFYRSIPLIADVCGILAVMGHTIDERARVTPETRRILQILFEEDQANVGEGIHGAGDREGSCAGGRDQKACSGTRGSDIQGL